MSVLIKGIEMPKNYEGCEVIIRIQPNGEVLDLQGFHIGATAIPVQPYDRLIDADVLLEEVYKLRMWLLENNMPGAEHWVTKVYQMIDEMSTVIEAEEKHEQISKGLLGQKL